MNKVQFKKLYKLYRIAFKEYCENNDRTLLDSYFLLDEDCKAQECHHSKDDNGYIPVSGDYKLYLFCGLTNLI